jgi:hypothetical protein
MADLRIDSQKKTVEITSLIKKPGTLIRMSFSDFETRVKADPFFIHGL